MGFREARRRAGFSVRDVMDALRVSDATVYNWETGTTTPRKRFLLKLADMYQCSVDELLRGNGE